MFDDLLKEIKSDVKEIKGTMKPLEIIGATVVFIAFGVILLVLPMIFI